MLKAGISVLLTVATLIVATPQTNAQDLNKLSLVTAHEEISDICNSPLKPYVITQSKNCPLERLRQTQSVLNVKEAKAEEFSVAHSISASIYTPTPTRAPSPTPTVIVSEMAVVTPSTPKPTVIVSEQNVTHVGNNPDIVLDLVNAHRASIGKTAFIKDEALCSLAQTRSNELAGEIANGSLHSGLFNRNLGYWITENAKVGGDENETLRWWLNSSIHRSQIQSDYTNACAGCTGKNCALLFTNYTPKGNKVALAE